MSGVATSATQALKGTLVLRKLPRTALPSDVRRLLETYGTEKVKNVQLDYQRFMSMGKAYVTFTDPAYAHLALSRLKTAQMSGIPLDVTTTASDVLENTSGRTRGSKGREEALQRGALDGNGPIAVGSERGKNVVIWGLPGRMTTDQLKAYLRSYRLASTEGGQEDILKVENTGRATLTSRHYVRTASVSEAHRLVRRLHMTPMKQYHRRYILQARVIY